jgi:hypothetical protein
MMTTMTMTRGQLKTNAIGRDETQKHSIVASFSR